MHADGLRVVDETPRIFPSGWPLHHALSRLIVGYRVIRFNSRSGIEQYGNLKYIKIFRQQGDHVRVAGIDLTEAHNYLNKNIQLLPGDVVIVPAKGYKEFDKRVSTIIPFTTTITAASIFLGTL